MEFSNYAGYTAQVDPEALKLAAEIEASRQEIAKLQERVKQLVARRGKRAELVKSAHILTAPELPSQPANIVAAPNAAPNGNLEKEFTIEEGLAALKAVPMSAVRLIAFKHGAIVFLFADEKTMTVRMDHRGPKPLLDLLTANEQNHAKTSNTSPDKRPRA
jgi:hypothetical protein